MYWPAVFGISISAAGSDYSRMVAPSSKGHPLVLQFCSAGVCLCHGWYSGPAEVLPTPDFVYRACKLCWLLISSLHFVCIGGTTGGHNLQTAIESFNSPLHSWSHLMLPLPAGIECVWKGKWAKKQVKGKFHVVTSASGHPPRWSS